MALILSSLTRLFLKLKAHKKSWKGCKLEDYRTRREKLLKKTGSASWNKKRVVKRLQSVKMKVLQL